MHRTPPYGDVDNLLESCDSQELIEWVNPHKDRIDSFRGRVEGLLASHRGIDVARSIKSGSSRSGHSQRSCASNTSSARIRLAEKKAKTIADKQVLEKAKALECEELALKREQARLEDFKRRVEVERAEIENKVLEAELDKIDSGSSIGRRSSVYLMDDAARSTQGCGGTKSGSWCSRSTVILFYRFCRQNEISSNLIVNQQQNFLPKRDLQTFDGSDVTEFGVFMRKFDKIIETRCSDPWDRLSYLEQFTAGEAQKLVKSCINDDPDLAYRQARTLLREEFGTEFKVTHAYLERLKEDVNFGDLVAFIREEVALLKQPLFGQIADPQSATKDKINKTRVITTTLPRHEAPGALRLL
ncbi:hypothetical protein HAZT_HAZT003442 [Hyalella azteca]|uniref:Uncharacterized protein n=1 Tax=Hyalella azteca TaxID=294128 RepID=A0A6A0H826_HYAAZ|nr:hypothetical protein HAZT_HAZT003442 [Hyalella azteca]